MEINIIKELEHYFKKWRYHFKIVFIFTFSSFLLSIFSTPKYTSYFSFYQKTSDSLGIIDAITGLDSDTLPLESLVKSQQLYIHLANKKWSNGKKIYEISGMDTALTGKIKNFFFDGNLSNLYTDKSINLLQEEIVVLRENNSDGSIEIYVEHEDKTLAKEISLEIISFVNNYYSSIFNKSAKEKNNFIDLRISDLENQISTLRQLIVEFKEKNKSIESPRLKEELRMLESELALKAEVYVQLYSQYEIKLLESVDKSDSVFLITDIYLQEKPTSPDILFDIIIATFLGLIITFSASIFKNNNWKFIEN
jgi:uncharacterized protein involved in exopolysaccharide biosynthesis